MLEGQEINTVKRKHRHEIFLFVVFEAFSVFLVYELLGFVIKNLFIVSSLMLAYIGSGVYIIYKKNSVFRKKLVRIESFISMCRGKIFFNKKLKIYLCSDKGHIFCLSENYPYMFIISIDNYLEKVNMGFSLDFVCFRLEKARRKKIKEIGNKVFIYEGIALVPNLKFENLLDRVKGIFAEISLEDARDKEEIRHLVGIVESYI